MSERQEGWDTDFIVTEGDLGTDARVIEPHGELDIATAPELEDALSRTCARRVVVDLTDVRFIDCAGLHVLVAARERIAAEGGELITICPDRNVRKVFELTELVHILNVVRTRRDALMLAGQFASSA